ncbi:MAG: glycine/sarcosine/betaine reductase selenoprotein B family protein [Bryobacteraceae bacterium]|nr:glycine/sarcosine/betaine reductase selenoprotein B family protein [Bryobacteraceae bacterium]
MAHLSDLKLTYRIYMAAYRYRQFDWLPGPVLAKPLAESRIAMLTTAGLHSPDQPAFDETIKGGDWSYRELPADVDLASLHLAHTSDAFDRAGIERDRNLVLPLDRLRELVAKRVIGEPAPRHFSFMGSIPAPGRLVNQTAPEVAAKLQDDRVDAVLLTPA